MVLSKKFDCTADDLDSVVLSLAKEIENGWHIYKIETNPFAVTLDIKISEPMFSVTLCRKNEYEV